jgi:uncharacterized protein
MELVSSVEAKTASKGSIISAFIGIALAQAEEGHPEGYFQLGVAFSTGSHGIPCDLIEAHKWFNLAATAGHAEAQLSRVDIAEEMTAREIAEAQNRARLWLIVNQRRAA